jgi:hypothetical protein
VSDETVVRHEGYDARTCLRCGKRGEDVPEGRLHYSKFENANLCRKCAGHPMTDSSAEPRRGETPPDVDAGGRVSETMWAIIGKHGLYCGTWRLRADAIAEHVWSKGRDWKSCRKTGDRAVKVTVTWSTP